MDELRALLRDTLRFSLHHFVPFCAIILPVLVPLEMLASLLLAIADEESVIHWLARIAIVLAFPIYQGAIIFYMASVVAGEPLPRSQCYRFALQLWWPLMLVYTFTTVAISLGLLLFILPGFIVMARLVFAEFYCALERAPPLQAMSASWEKTEPYQWFILGGLIAVYVVVMLPFWLAGALLPVPDEFGLVSGFFADLLGAVLLVPITVFGFRVYMWHREKQLPVQVADN